MNYNDIVSLYGYSIYIGQWLLPIAMIFLYDFKTSKLNKLYQIVYLITIPALTLFYICDIFFPTIPIMQSTFGVFATFRLMALYFIIGTTFAMYLITIKKWEFPQAFSISMIATILGTFFWEIPTVIFNFYDRGFEIDILLQLVALLFFFFLYMKHAWKSDKKSKYAFVIGLLISVLFFYFRQPFPTDPSLYARYWNSYYFMTNRFISTMIVIYCVNTNKPMEKSKSK